MESSASDIIDFWFSSEAKQHWFSGDAGFDQLLQEKFSTINASAQEGEYKEWEDDRNGRLALILLLDQFSRNLHRGTETAFAGDTRALAIARKALEYGDDLWLKEEKPGGQLFYYLPFMHSESLEDQNRCVHLIQTHGPEYSVDFAFSHRDVIYRFGRFPQRNAALNRNTTDAESVFLNMGHGQW